MNKTFNTPEEVAAWLPDDIAEKFLAVQLMFVQPKTLLNAIQDVMEFVQTEDESHYWELVYHRALAGEFDRPAEGTEQANDFFKHYETFFKASPFRDWPENADKLDNDAKLKLMGPLLDTFGPILLRALFRLGLQDKGVYQHLDINWEGVAGEWVLSLLNKKHTPIRSLDEIKDEVAREYSEFTQTWFNLIEHFAVEGMDYREFIQKENIAMERYAASESAHHRARAEQLEAENKRLKEELVDLYKRYLAQFLNPIEPLNKKEGGNNA